MRLVLHGWLRLRVCGLRLRLCGLRLRLWYLLHSWPRLHLVLRARAINCFCTELRIAHNSAHLRVAYLNELSASPHMLEKKAVGPTGAGLDAHTYFGLSGTGLALW
jgi:hypothetical protein